MIDAVAYDLYAHLSAAALTVGDQQPVVTWASEVGPVVLTAPERPAAEGKQDAIPPDPGHAGAILLEDGINGLAAVQIRNQFRYMDGSGNSIASPWVFPTTEQSFVVVQEWPVANDNPGRGWINFVDTQDQDPGATKHAVYADLGNWGDAVTPDWRLGLYASADDEVAVWRNEWREFPILSVDPYKGAHVIIGRRNAVGYDLWLDGVQVFAQAVDLTTGPINVNQWWVGTGDVIQSSNPNDINEPYTYDFSWCDLVADVGFSDRHWTDTEVNQLSYDLSQEYLTPFGGTLPPNAGPPPVDIAVEAGGAGLASVDPLRTPVGMPTGLKRRRRLAR